MKIPKMKHLPCKFALPSIRASTKPGVGSKAAVLTTAIDSKGSLKNMTKIKGKRDSSENKIVQRKALSDLSNLTSFVSSTKVYDGSKSMKNERTALLERIKPASMTAVLKLSDQVFLTSIQDNQESTSTLKEVFTGVEKGKSKVCESASHQASYGKNHISRNRGSDSFVMIKVLIRDRSEMLFQSPTLKYRFATKNLRATKSGSNSAARILPRSFKPSVKTALRPSNTQRASKSKCSSGLKKQVSVAAISSKKDIECTLPANNVAAISSEASQKDLLSNGNSDASINMPDILTRKKAKRRRSYTSLLMTRSKLLEGNGVKEEEKLPGIDKDDNPLEVAQYVDEIYQYYWTTEALNPSLENYMSIQKDITPHMRGILINWLIEVHLKFDLMQETLYLMVTLLDRYLSEVQIKKNEMQLVGLTTLLLASKYEDFWHPRVKDLISISAEAYTSEQMLKMEKLVLKELKFRLNAPTPYVFMLRFIKAAQSDTKLEHLAFYLIELCLVEYEALKFKPSLLCASAIYVARCTLQMECAEMILRFQRAASSGQLKVTFEKYASHELSQVAMITPLGRLP
ncbi:hypothetical protein GOBAR_DD00539 [Gossypium barbadense]|nr:hypothetical protein GOBAR_DD00539 [Gossypium barbadense]